MATQSFSKQKFSTDQHEAAYFCHGMPGGIRDAQLLKNVDTGVDLITPHLLRAKKTDPLEDILNGFDADCRGYADGQIHVIGFSIGAMVALKIAAARPERVGKLTLISPAAPLSLGDFLPEMAGKLIFKLAISSPAALRGLTALQGAVLRIAPNTLLNQLFAKCGSSEQDLLKDPVFREVLVDGLNNSFRQHPNAYIRFLRCYISDWAKEIERVKCPVDLWHGEKDTWAPIAMSQHLSARFAVPSRMNCLSDKEHYSTLAEVSLEPIQSKGGGANESR